MLTMVGHPGGEEHGRRRRRGALSRWIEERLTPRFDLLLTGVLDVLLLVGMMYLNVGLDYIAGWVAPHHAEDWVVEVMKMLVQVSTLVAGSAILVRDIVVGLLRIFKWPALTRILRRIFRQQ